MLKKLFLSLMLSLTLTSVCADEGMWLPSLIGSRIKDMRKKGFRLSAEDIYSINKASLKDAGAGTFAYQPPLWLWLNSAIIVCGARLPDKRLLGEVAG